MLIDCKSLSDKIRKDIKKKIEDYTRFNNPNPVLAVVMVGENPASQIYVRNKTNACQDVGIETTTFTYPEDITTYQLCECIELLNANPGIDAILVQLPLPEHIDANKVIRAISPEKDADGITPENVARLWMNDKPIVEPCTPKGIIAILDSINFQYEGADVVVLGRSNIVGKPIAKMLMDRGCTVTICHSKTLDPSKKYNCRMADLIVSAVGIKDYLDSWFTTLFGKQVIIDVGINRDENGKVCGDVNKELYDRKNLQITPVPGGVGPMTITMLLENTFELYKRRVDR